MGQDGREEQVGKPVGKIVQKSVEKVVEKTTGGVVEDAWLDAA